MKPKLLFLSQCLPFPPHSGVTNRTYHVLKGLAAAFEVSLLPFTRKGHQEDEEAIGRARMALESLGVHVRGPFGLASEQSVLNNFAVHGLSLCTGKAYTYFDYGASAFGDALKNELQDNTPGLVHMDSLDLHRWIPLLRGFPLACTHHSIESDLLRLLAKWERSLPARLYLRRQANAVERLERRLCPAMDLNIVMSDIDAARLTQIAPTSKVCIVPNGVDVASMAPVAAQLSVPKRIAFLGGSYVRANRDAIQYFLEQIWPRVHRSHPDATFLVIGKVEESHRLAFESHPNVACTGFVEDLKSAMASAECFVAPLRIGGGTRLKILDAWAMGKPVISTSIGCEGLYYADGEDILVRDTPASFAAAVNQLLTNPDRICSLGLAARRRAVEHYSWTTITSHLAGKYQTLLSKRETDSDGGTTKCSCDT